MPQLVGEKCTVPNKFGLPEIGTLSRFQERILSVIAGLKRTTERVEKKIERETCPK